MSQWETKPWFSMWLVISLFVLLFPHSTESDGVHFHDEIIVEDWTKAHLEGHIVIPIHKTTGQTIDAIPLIVDGSNVSLSFSFFQEPTSYGSQMNFDNRICVIMTDGTKIENGSMAMQPLEHPEIALEGWVDEHGCVNFVAREPQNQLLTFNLSCPEHITSQICSGQFIISSNVGKAWDMNLEGGLQTASASTETLITIQDKISKMALNEVTFTHLGNEFGNTNTKGEITLNSQLLSNQSLEITNIDASIDEVSLNIDGVSWNFPVQNQTVVLPSFTRYSLSIKAVDQYQWSWDQVAISLVGDEEYGGLVAPLGVNTIEESLVWTGHLPDGAHQILGITLNESIPIPSAPAYSTASGEPTFLNRFTIGNSLYMAVFSIFSLAEYAGLLSLGILNWSCRRLSNQTNQSLSSQWSGAVLLNGSATMVIIAHADFMSDLHSVALIFLSISFIHPFFKEQTYTQTFDRWGNLLLAGLLLGIAFSIRFVNMIYLPIILILPFVYSKLSKDKIREKLAIGILLISCLLALIPLLAYHDTYHGHIMNYNASDDETIPTKNNALYDWESISSHPSFHEQFKNQNFEPMLDQSGSVFIFSSSFFESEWIPFSVHDRSYTAQILTIGIVSLMYAPVIVLAILCYAIHMAKSRSKTTNFQSMETWFVLFILTGIIGLMIERSPFFVSHWSDDNRYLTPMIAPSALLCARLIPNLLGPNHWMKRKNQLAGICLLICMFCLTIPRLLWQGTRKPMPTSRGLALNGKFDLTYFYEYTNTPTWILDAQFFWHPFSERLTYAGYEVVALIFSLIGIGLLMLKLPNKQDVEEEG